MLLNLKASTYQSYELGICYPPLPLLIDIATLFRMSVDYLSGKTNDETPLYPRGRYDFNQFPEILRNARMKKGMLQKEAAASIHVSVTSYACYELNLRTPSFLHFFELSNLFDISCDTLLGWKEGDS